MFVTGVGELERIMIGAHGEDEIDQMRELVLAQLRRSQRGPTTRRNDSVNTESPENFAEEQGGFY